MSVENAKKFLDILEKNQELQAKLKVEESIVSLAKAILQGPYIHSCRA